jgi:hypothetical protein
MYTYTLLLLCIKGISIKHYRLASKGCCLATADCRPETIYGLLTGDCRLATGDCYQGGVDNKKISHNVFPPIFIFGKP